MKQLAMCIPFCLAALLAMAAVRASAQPQTIAYATLVSGAPLEDLFEYWDAGAIHLLPGSAAGPTTDGEVFWHQGLAGSADNAEVNDYFGRALVGGDFDGDGQDDLAVGVPLEEVGGVRAGAVHVFPGDGPALSLDGDRLWHQDVPGIAGANEEGDSFGSALVAADFNGDGYVDLAVGIRAEDIGDVINAGSTVIIYGSASGLTAAGSQGWHQGSAGVGGLNSAADHFGWALAAADFDGDGYADLAIGEIGEDDEAGAVTVLYGGSQGLDTDGVQAWNQDNAGLGNGSLSGEYFGYALAAGDFDGDGYGDLAVGAPHESFAGAIWAGAVGVLYGTPAGLAAGGSQFWHQDVETIAGANEEADRFGRELAAGDFNGDGFDDLAVGIPTEAVGDSIGTGSVTVIYGSASGLTAAGNQGWHRGVPGVPGENEPGDQFGYSLVSGDFDGDGYADLAVGAPNADLPGASEAGELYVLPGSAQGLSVTGSARWHQDSAGVSDTAETDDYFAYALGVLHPTLVAPGLLAPVEGATTDNRPLLQWSPAVLATRYHLQVAAGQAWDAAVVDVWLTGTTYEVGVPLPDGDYWWRARLRDSVGRHSPWSEPRQFRVGARNYLPLLLNR